MDVERGGFERGEAIGHGGERLSDGVKVVERLGEPEVGQSIAQDLEPQERGTLLVHPQHGALGASPEDMMAVLDLFEKGLQFATEPLGEPEPEDLRDLVRGQSKQAEVAGSLEQFMDRQVAPKDQVSAVLDLLEGVVPAEVDRRAIFGGELRADRPGPVLQALTNDRRTEAIRRGLQDRRVRRGEERIVVFAKAEAEAEEFSLDEVMAVEIVGDVERQEGPHTQQHRPQDFVANVEVVMRVTTTLRRNETVGRIRCGELGRADPEAGSQFHAFQDEVHAEPLLTFHPVQRRPDVVLFADALLGPFDRNVLLSREGVDPAVVLVSPLAQRLFRDRIRPMDIAEEMHDVLRSREERHVPEDDHAVEAVVYKYHQAAKQLGEGFHRSPPGVVVSATRSSVKRPVGTNSIDHGDSTEHGTFGAPPIDKGSALEVPRTTPPCVTNVQRDFKGRALG